METPTFLPASAFSLEALGDIFTRSFENYFYPGTMTAAMLAARVRIEQLDLYRSLVMHLGDDVAGIALLGLRSDRAWCGGFGVVLPLRGRGLAHELVTAMLEQARQAGAIGCGLEVLTRNQAAIKTYERAGFQAVRDLQVLEWRRPQEALMPNMPGNDQIVQLHPSALLAHFTALHAAPAAWQRDLPALLARGGMHGLALMDGEQLRAYALITPTPDHAARIEDIGAVDVERAATLLATIQMRYTRLISVNEPAESRLTPAFETVGFIEADRQHELWINL